MIAKLNQSSCTAVLVGKKATVDGSTLIARNEDAAGGINPKRFIVMQPADQPQEFVSTFNGFHTKLPDNPLRYTATPVADTSDGEWGESGINTDNVAMSSTETEFTNTTMLGLDPLVPDGIGEEAMLTCVLPYVHTAREGVQRLGALVTKYGTCESNGIAFSDSDEVWYFETVGGHHWAAQRIPDDTYVIAPNQTGIQEIDFNDPDHYMYSADLKEFAEKYHLNPAKDGFNFRDIFGEDTLADHYYNTPRVWYGQKMLNPELNQDPESRDMPFTRVPSHLISVKDVALILSSHYQATEFDPYGQTGTPESRLRYRPIGMNRNQEMHILQIRPNFPKEHTAIHWLAEGVNIFNTPVPFFANCDDTPQNFQFTPNDKASTDSFYWLNKIIAMIGDGFFAQHDEDAMVAVSESRKFGFAAGIAAVAAADAAYAKVTPEDLPAWHTAQNAQVAAKITANLEDLLHTLVAMRAEKMVPTFEKGGEL
ncbi:dipeptidase [Agrilactobacillus composti DSM 18527 = JCM 14202]|uniref:Dipeptidase n=1 Tax=Agrilactobacillus composti DSM 18527 = JCM 14202 TaxID=1423734 RepID=A0A0R1XK66_9LACO|nr:C69 family dipeptidase [Agrilactobacillus composti]KRM30558.1 dipeptidase [Agrilactobacillus composti DSM 18527 = JCM 14202]